MALFPANYAGLLRSGPSCTWTLQVSNARRSYYALLVGTSTSSFTLGTEYMLIFFTPSSIRSCASERPFLSPFFFSSFCFAFSAF